MTCRWFPIRTVQIMFSISRRRLYWSSKFNQQFYHFFARFFFKLCLLLKLESVDNKDHPACHWRHLRSVSQLFQTCEALGKSLKPNHALSGISLYILNHENLYQSFVGLSVPFLTKVSLILKVFKLRLWNLVYLMNLKANSCPILIFQAFY